MLLRFRTRKDIQEQRRKNMEARVRLLNMARLFESDTERRKRADLQKLRNQDWK